MCHISDHPEEDGPLMIDDMTTTTIRPTPGFILTTTLTPGYTMECTHHDQVFADGALIATDKACEHCYCMKGDIVCAIQDCGTPMENEGKNCTPIAPKEGQCCPDNFVCEGEEDVTTVLSESDKDSTTTEDIKTIEQELETSVPAVDASHADSDSDKHATTEGIKHEPEKETTKPELDATTMLTESNKEATTESLKHAPENEIDSEQTIADSDINKVATTHGFKHEQELSTTKPEKYETSSPHADKDITTTEDIKIIEQELETSKPEIDASHADSDSAKHATTEGIKHEPEAETSKPEYDATTALSESDKEATTGGLKHVPEVNKDSYTTTADFETDDEATTESFIHVPEIDTSNSELDATTKHFEVDDANESIKQVPEIEASKPEIDTSTILSESTKDATTEGFKHEQKIDTSKPEQDVITEHPYVDQEAITQGVKHELEKGTSKPDADASYTLLESEKYTTTEGFKDQEELDTFKPEQIATTIHPADQDAATKDIERKPELDTSKPEIDTTTIISDTDKDAITEGFKHEDEIKATKPEKDITTLHSQSEQDATTQGIKQDTEIETSKPELDAITVLSESNKDVTTEGFKHEHEIKKTKPEQDVTTLHPYADQDATTQSIKHEPELETSEPKFDATTILSESDITTEGFKHVPETETSKPVSDATNLDFETDKAATTEGFKHVPEVEASTSKSDSPTEHSDVNRDDATESMKHDLEIEVTKSDLDATTILPESVKHATTQSIKNASEIEEGKPFEGVTTEIIDSEKDSTTQIIKIEQDLEVLKPDEVTIQSTEEEKIVTERILTQTTLTSDANEDIPKTTVGLRDNKGENEEPEENVSENEISEHTDKVTESSIGEIDSTEKHKDYTSPKDIQLVPSTEDYGSTHISYDQKTDNVVPEKVDEFTGKPTTVLENVELDSVIDDHLTTPSLITDKTNAESHTTPKQTEDKIDEENISQQEVVVQEQEKSPSVKKEDHTVSGLSEIETTTSSLISGQSITKEADIETTKYPDYFDQPHKSSNEPTDDFDDVFAHTEASEIGGSTLSDNLNTRYTNEEDTDKTEDNKISEIVKEKPNDVTKIPVEESSGDGILIDEFGSGDYTTVESPNSKVHISDKDVEYETKKPISEIVSEPEITTQSIEKLTHIPSIIDEHSAENDSSEQDASQEITTDNLIDDKITTIHEYKKTDITVHPNIDEEIHELTTAPIIADLEYQTNIPVDISSESSQEFTTTHSVSKLKTDKPTPEKEPIEEVFESTTSLHDTDGKESEKEVESQEEEYITTHLIDDSHAIAEDITSEYDSLDKTTESQKLDHETRSPEISELDLEKKTLKPEVQKTSTTKPEDQDIITELSQTVPEIDHLIPEEGYEQTTLDSTESSENEHPKTEDHDVQQKTTLLPERESNIEGLHVTTPSVKDVTDSQNIQPDSTQKPLHSVDEEISATTKLSAEIELDHTETIDTEDKVHYADHDITTLSSNEYDSYSEIPLVTHPEDVDGNKDDDKKVTILPHDDHTYSPDEITSLPVEVASVGSGGKIDVTTLRPSSETEVESHSEEHPISEDEIKHTTTMVSSQKPETDNIRTKVPEQITTETPTTVIDIQENEINENQHKQPIDEPRIPGEGDCLVDGQSYKNKALIPTTNRCQTVCQCVNSIIKCDHVVCSPPPLNMVNCQPVYHGKDTCCPMYTCEHESVTIESDNQMSEHSTPSVDQSIKYVTESPIEKDKIHEDVVTEQVAISYKPTKDFTSDIEKGTTQLPVDEKIIIPSIYVPDCGTAGCKITKTPSEIFTEKYDETTKEHVTSGEYTTLHSIADTKQQEIDSQTLRPVSSDFETERPSVQDQTTLISELEKEIQHQPTEKSSEEYDIQKTTVVISSHVSDNQDETTEDAVRESTDDKVKVEITTATPEYITVTTEEIEKESSIETLKIAGHEKDQSEQTQTDIEITTTTPEKETKTPDIHQLGHDTDSEDKEQTTELDTYEKTEQSLDAAPTEKPDASVDDSHKSDDSEISSTPNIVKTETLSPSIDENKIDEDDHTEKTIIDEENITTYAPDHAQKIFNQVETPSKPSGVEAIDEDSKKSQESTTKVSPEQVTSVPVINYTTVSSDDVNRIGVSVLPTDSVDEISPKKPDSSVVGDCGHAGCQVEAQYTSLPIDITTIAPVSGDCQSGDCLDKTKASAPKESDCGKNGCEDDEQNTIGDDLDKPVCGPNGCDYGTKHNKIDSTTEIYLKETHTTVPSSSKPSEESSTEAKADCENGLCTYNEEIPYHHKDITVTPDQCSGEKCVDKPIDVPVKTDDGEDIIRTTAHVDKDSQTVKPDKSTSYPDGCSSPSCLEKPSGPPESPTTTKIPTSDEKCSGENCEEAKLPSGEEKCTGDNCEQTKVTIGEEKCSGDNCEEVVLPFGEDECTGDSCDETQMHIDGEKCTGESCSTKSELESGTKPSLEDSEIDEHQKPDGHEVTSQPDISFEKEPQGTKVPTRGTTESVDLGDDKITLRPTVIEKSTDKTVDKSTTESSTEIPITTGYIMQQPETLSPQSHAVETDSTTVKTAGADENESTTVTIEEEHITQANKIDSSKKPQEADISIEDDQLLEKPGQTKNQTLKTTIGPDTETYTAPSVTKSVDEDDFAVTDSEHVTDSHKHVDHHEVDEKDNQITKEDDSPKVIEQSSEPALTDRPDVHVTTAFEDQNTKAYPESIDTSTSIDKTEEKEPTEHSLGKEQTTIRPVTDNILVKDVEPLIGGEDDEVTKRIDFVTEADIEHSTIFDENKEDELDNDQVNYEKLIPTTVRIQEYEKTTDKPLVDKTIKPVTGGEISHTTEVIESNEHKDISDKISTDKSEEDDLIRTTVTESEITKPTTHAQESITHASETSFEEDVTAGVDQTKHEGIVETDLKDTHITTETDVTESSDTPKPTIVIEDSEVVHTTAVYADDVNHTPIEQEIETMHTTLSSHDDDVKKPSIPIEDMKHAETTSVDDLKKTTEPTIIIIDDIGQATLSPISEDKHVTKLDFGIEITQTTVLPIEDRDKTTIPSKLEEDHEAAKPSKEDETAHTTSHAEHEAEKVTESATQAEIEHHTEKAEVAAPTETSEKEKISQITKLHESGTEKYTTVPMAEDEETVTQIADIEKLFEEDSDVTHSTVSTVIPPSTEVSKKETEKGEQKPEQHLSVDEHEKTPHETDHFTKGQDIDQTIDFGEEEIDQIKVQGPSDDGIYPTVSGGGEQSEIYTTPIGENVDVRKPTEEEIVHTTISGEHVTTVKIPVDQPEESHTVTISESDESEKPTGKPEEDIAHTTISFDSDDVEKTTDQLEEEIDQTTEKNKVKTPAEELEEGNVQTTVSTGSDKAKRPADKPQYDEDHTTVSSESDENKKPTEQTDKDVVQTTVSSESDETKRPTEHLAEDKHTTFSSESEPEDQTDKDVVQTTVSSEIDESKRPSEHFEGEKHTTVSSKDDDARRPTEKPEDYEYHTTVSADQYDVKKPTEHPDNEVHTAVSLEDDATKGSTEKSEVGIPTTISSDKYDQEKPTDHPKDSEKTTVTLKADEAKRPTDNSDEGVDHTTITSDSDEVKKPTEHTDEDVVQTTVSSERDETKRPTEHSEDDKYITVSSDSDDENKSTEKPGADDDHTTISADKYDVKKPTEHVEEAAHTTVRSEVDESNRLTEHPEDSVHTTVSLEIEEAKRPTEKPEHGVDHTTITSERDEVRKPTEDADKDIVQTTVSSEIEETKRPTEHSEDHSYTTVSSDVENKLTEQPGVDAAHTTISADKYDVKKPTEEEAYTTVKSEIDNSNRPTEHPEDSVHVAVGVESDEGKRPTDKPAYDLDHTTVISESDEVKMPIEQTDKEVMEATTSSGSDETKKPSEESVEVEKDEPIPQIYEKQPDTEATTASDKSTPFNKSSEYPFTSTVTVHDYITSKIPTTAADVTTEVPYQATSKYPDTAVDPGLDQAEISSIPNPDEDEDHQVPQLPNFPPSYGSSGNEEPDYEGEDQAFGPGTCRYGGKVYVSAQQIPRDDPCDFCFCFRSDIICLQQSCPPPIQHCHEEPIQGFCCPRYECPVSMATVMNVTTTTTTTTTTLPPHFLSHAYKGAAQRRGCQIKGQSYQVGETIKQTSGPCLHCM